MYNKDDMICSFCVNDYHLSVILVQYIYDTINEEKNIITFFDRDYEDIVNKVIITNEKYWKSDSKFKKIDWKKTRFDLLSKKFENSKDGDLVIVSGTEDYIERINRLLINFHTNFTIINCYYIEDIARKDYFNISNYGKILNTKGLQENKEINFV